MVLYLVSNLYTLLLNCNRNIASGYKPCIHYLTNSLCHTSLGLTLSSLYCFSRSCYSATICAYSYLLSYVCSWRFCTFWPRLSLSDIVSNLARYLASLEVSLRRGLDFSSRSCSNFLKLLFGFIDCRTTRSLTPNLV